MAYPIATGDVAKPVFLVDPATGIAYSAAGGTGGSASQVQGNVASGVTDVGNPVKIGGVFKASLPTFTDGQRGDAQIDSHGNLRMRLTGYPAITGDGTGNQLIYGSDSTGGDTIARLLAIAPFNFNGSTWDRPYKPNAASRITASAASTNATLAKNATGNLFLAAGYNSNAAVRYLKIYNKASAPTVGTDTPTFTFALPPTGAFAIDLPSQYFSTGIAYALTTGSADSDTGAVAANDILGLNIAYA